jgi:hypothetical protein
MAFEVPPKHVIHIQSLLQLSDAQTTEFLGALANAGPKFNVDDLAESISKSVELQPSLIRGIISVLASLYLTRDGENAPIEEFIDQDVFLALKNSGILSVERSEIEWPKLRQFLIAGLSLENTLGTAAKAGYVLTQNERLFIGARILTDIRPIFHLNVNDKPESAVLVHMLRITQRDNQNNVRELFFALDSNDIQSLLDVAERAIKKEKTLIGLMKDSGVSILQPKDFF